MQTTGRRTKDWVPGRRRRGGVAGGRPRPDLHADISPVWEIVPQGARDIGARARVLRRDSRLRRGLAFVDVLSAYLALLVVISLIQPGSVHLRPTTVLIQSLRKTTQNSLCRAQTFRKCASDFTAEELQQRKIQH